MEIPQPILDAVRAVVVANMEDLEEQKSAARVAVRGLPNFCDLADLLIDSMIAEIVYDTRCSINATIRRRALAPSKPAGEPVVAYASSAFQQIADSVFKKAIGRKTLGQLTGKELDLYAESESDLARGHSENAELLRWCRDQGVKDDERVDERLTEAAVKKAYARICKASR